MAKYKRRPKVKRYRRSFYSRGMRIRKIVGIVVLVAVVLAAAWFAAPHVLDWATHTWYTVVKDRDLEAESASRAAGFRFLQRRIIWRDFLSLTAVTEQVLTI